MLELDPATVTIHHTAFADSPTAIGKRILKFATAPESIEQAGDLAFEATNNPHVTNLTELTISAEGRCYSTSVGDVIEWCDKFAVVIPVGFMEISRKELDDALAYWTTCNQAFENGQTPSAFDFGFRGIRRIKVCRQEAGVSLNTPI